MNPISPTPAGEDKTPTPMTDAQECTSSRYDGEEIPGFDYVPSSFARSLERRISALEGDKAIVDWLGDPNAPTDRHDEVEKFLTEGGIYRYAVALAMMHDRIDAASQPSAMKGGQG